jgi:hypothetical protein
VSSAVEKAWLKFVDKFHAFQKMPSNEKDKKAHKAWEAILKTTDVAAYKVMEQRATCLRDMEIKIWAWAFIAEVPKDGTLNGLINWKSNSRWMGNDSDFIVSLRDDIRLMKRLVCGANIVVGSIAAAPPPMPDMPPPIPSTARRCNHDTAKRAHRRPGQCPGGFR